MVKYISFDFDGTLVTEKFDNLIWWEEIPKLYANKNNINLEKAKTFVYADYYKSLYIEKVQRWTDIEYWFDRLSLNGWETLIEDMKKHVLVYEDTIDTLQYLSQKYKLLIISNAHEKFLKLKLDIGGLRKYFNHVFSAPSNFGLSSKNKYMFMEIMKLLKANEKDIIHVGDHYELDYLVPSNLGIKSYYLVRGKNKKEPHEITSLADLKEKL